MEDLFVTSNIKLIKYIVLASTCTLGPKSSCRDKFELIGTQHYLDPDRDCQRIINFTDTDSY